MSEKSHLLDDFKVTNWHKGKVELEQLSNPMEFRPSQLHFKEDGSINHEPSFVIIMTSSRSNVTPFGQISLAMLNAALNELGYNISKT